MTKVKHIDDVYSSAFKLALVGIQKALKPIECDFFVGYKHVIERAKQRYISIDDIILAIRKFSANRLCEFVYAIHVGGIIDTIEVRYKDLILVIVRDNIPGNKRWGLVTVLDANIHNVKTYSCPPDNLYIIEIK